MHKVFDHPVRGREAVNQLLSFRQGSQSASDFMVTFLHSHGGDLVGTGSSAGSFQKGLPDKIGDELAIGDDARSLDELADQAIPLDNRMRERCRERGGPKEFLFCSFATSAPPEV